MGLMMAFEEYIKRAVSALLIFAMIWMRSACAQTDNEILFRNAPWGISFSEAYEKLPEYKLYPLVIRPFETFSIDQIVNDKEGIEFANKNIGLLGITYNHCVRIAGFTTSDIKLYFAYKPVDGLLTKKESDSALYAARYEFVTPIIQTFEADMTTKLTALYGTPDKTEYDRNKWGKDIKTIYWYGANDTGLALTLTYEPPSMKVLNPKDSAMLTYYTSKGDEWLKAASDAEAYKETFKPNASADSSDSSGL